jgi:hypothetical protein
VPRLQIGLCIACALLAWAPAPECAAQRATRVRAERVRVERVTTVRRVPIRRAHVAVAPAPSMADRLRDGASPAGGEAPTGPAPALLARGEARTIERAVFGGDFALVRTTDGEIERVGFDVLDALLLGAIATAPEGMATLTLADGRRIVGSLRTNGAPAIEHPLFGRFGFTDAARLTLAPAPDAPTLDEPGVVLRNGDSLLGAPVALAGGVAIELHDRATLLPWDRIAAAVFDAPTHPVHAGLRAHLADGSIVGVHEATTRPDTGGAVDLALASGRAVRLAPGALVGLSRSGAAMAALAPSPTLETHDGALLAQPGTHTLELPAGARLVRGVVTLPESARRWGTAYITLWSAGEPVFFTVLDSDRPGARFGVPVRGPVTMTVHSARGGAANAVTGLTGETLVLAED